MPAPVVRSVVPPRPATYHGPTVPGVRPAPPEPMRPILLLPCNLLIAFVVGCSSRSTTTTVAGPDPVAPGAAIVATQPSARATSAPYDGDIWAQFDRPLDAGSVNERTVYLKLDGQRVSSAIRYDVFSRRVFVQPRVVLALQRTYTVEFSTAIRPTDGSTLPSGLYFQFTTNSLRRVSYDFPAVDALEGPVAALGWAGATGAVNDILHEVYASEDSAAVLARTLAPLQRTVFTRFLPGTRWRPGSRVFWAVTTENVVTRERENGPLRSFRVLDPAAPVDSLVLRPLDVGSNLVTNANTQFCASQTLPSGPSYNAAVHWSFSGLPADARLVGARVRLQVVDANANSFDRSLPSVWLAQNDWNACQVRAPGPPFTEATGLLASGTPVDAITVDFASDRLAACLEALHRRRSFVFGTLFRTQTNVSFHSPSAPDQSRIPVLVVRYQRAPAALAGE